MGRLEVRLAGEGGQGLVLAGIILTEAAAMFDGKNALMTQSYGSQQRGGPSRSEVIISDQEIDYPKVLAADVLLCLTQDAYDAHRHQVCENGIIVIDGGEVKADGDERVVALPIAQITKEATGHLLAISLTALGVLQELTGIVSRQALLQAVRQRAPRGTEEVNQRAVEAGMAAARGLKGVPRHNRGSTP